MYTSLLEVIEMKSIKKDSDNCSKAITWACNVFGILLKCKTFISFKTIGTIKEKTYCVYINFSCVS